jgi:hypothetical protein
MGKASDTRVYHRLESPTQTPSDAAQQETTGEIWGQASVWSTRPTVKAYAGPLPDGKRGIEFMTDVLPDLGSAPFRPEWSGPRPGVVVAGSFAKIAVTVTKNTQT